MLQTSASTPDGNRQRRAWTKAMEVMQGPSVAQEPSLPVVYQLNIQLTVQASGMHGCMVRVSGDACIGASCAQALRLPMMSEVDIILLSATRPSPRCCPASCCWWCKGAGFYHVIARSAAGCLP